MGVDEKERERAILDATAQLLLEHGYNKLTMNDVADAVGLNRRLIYLLFPTKDALIGALLKREMNSYIEEWDRYLDRDPLGGSVASVYRSLLVEMKRRPLLAAIYTRDEQTFGKYLHKRDGFFARWAPDPGPTREYLEAMQKIGVVRRDINTRAVAFILDALTPSIMKALSSYTPASTPTSIRAPLGGAIRSELPSFDELVETVAELCDRLLTPAQGTNFEAGKEFMRRRVAEAQVQYSPTDKNENTDNEQKSDE